MCVSESYYRSNMPYNYLFMYLWVSTMPHVSTFGWWPLHPFSRAIYAMLLVGLRCAQRHGGEAIDLFNKDTTRLLFEPEHMRVEFDCGRILLQGQLEGGATNWEVDEDTTAMTLFDIFVSPHSHIQSWKCSRHV